MNRDDMQFDVMSNKYLRGKLTPEEAIEFENYILDKPDLVEQLEMDKALFESLPKVEFESSKASGQKERSKKYWFSIFTPLAGVMATAVVFLGIQLNFLKVVDPGEGSSGAVQLVFPDSANRGEAIPISIKAGVSHVVLAFEPSDFSVEFYDVVLRRSSDRKIVELYENVAVASAGYIVVLVEQEVVADQEYVVEIMQADNERVLDKYSVVFKLR